MLNVVFDILTSENTYTAYNWQLRHVLHIIEKSLALECKFLAKYANICKYEWSNNQIY